MCSEHRFGPEGEGCKHKGPSVPRALAGRGLARKEGFSRVMQKQKKVLLQACCPREASIGRRGSPDMASRAPQTAAESSCAPGGSGSNSRDNEDARQRFSCSRGPLAASLHARSLPVTAVLLRLSAGICLRPGGQAGEPLGSWPDAAAISLAPGFLSHFQLCCFSFGTAVHPPPPSIHCPASVWQTKLVSPLIRKAGFLAAWRHLCSNPASGEESSSHLHRPQPRSAKQGRLCAPRRWGLCQLGKSGRPLSPGGEEQAGTISSPQVALHSPKLGFKLPTEEDSILI